MDYLDEYPRSIIINEIERLWIDFVLKRFNKSFGFSGYIFFVSLAVLGLINIFQKDISDGIYIIGLAFLVFILNTERGKNGLYFFGIAITSFSNIY